MHELTGTKHLSLRCPHLSLTRVSALQLRGDRNQCDKHVPSAAQEGKEEDRENGAASCHPSKRYENREAGVFQTPGTAMEGKQCMGCQALALCTHPACGQCICGGKHAQCLLLGPGLHPHSLRYGRVITASKPEASAPCNREESRTSATTFTLILRIRVRQDELSLWG